MYPRNAAAPERIAVGSVYLIADGTIQTAAVLVRVMPQGGAAASGTGTLNVDATSGVWYYTPSQAETNYTSFMVMIYKASCTSACVTVVTTASSVPGNVQLAVSQPAITFASLVCTGAFTISDGLIITASTTNRSAISATGNGTGHGINAVGGSGTQTCGIRATSTGTFSYGVYAAGAAIGMYCEGALAGFNAESPVWGGVFHSTNGGALFLSAEATLPGLRVEGGTGATSNAVEFTSKSTNGSGLVVAGTGTGYGLSVTGGATGHGVHIVAGSTSGDGVHIDVTSGDGVESPSLIVTGATTLTGAVTAANASNNIVGVTLTATTGLGNQTANITGTVSGNSTHNAAAVYTAFGTGSNLTALASATNLATVAGYLDTEIAGIITTLGVAGAGLTALASATNLATVSTAVVTTIPGTITTLQGNVTSILVDTGTTLDELIKDLPTNAELATAFATAWSTTTIAEDYPADAAPATPAELLYLILSCVSQFDITTTVLTTRKLDGTTASATYTLDSATTPTSRVRAT